MENNIYCDPNAYIKRVVEEPKQKVDLMHIEKVLYPVNYDNFNTHYDYSSFDKKKNYQPQQNNHNSSFDISKLLPLLAGGNGSLESMLPSLLSGLGINKDVVPLLSNFTKMNKTKKVTAKVVETENSDSISKYKKVENKID